MLEGKPLSTASKKINSSTLPISMSTARTQDQHSGFRIQGRTRLSPCLLPARQRHFATSWRDATVFLCVLGARKRLNTEATEILRALRVEVFGGSKNMENLVSAATSGLPCSTGNPDSQGLGAEPSAAHPVRGNGIVAAQRQGLVGFLPLSPKYGREALQGPHPFELALDVGVQRVVRLEGRDRRTEDVDLGGSILPQPHLAGVSKICHPHRVYSSSPQINQRLVTPSRRAAETFVHPPAWRYC
jgi:hypothetical protein